ncbi:MAG: response regulator transcription factor [Pseudonocardiales bacterium]
MLTVVASAGAAGAGIHGAGIGRIDSLDTIENVVRHLVTLVRRQGPGSLSAAKGAILDLQVDDVRCRLEAAGSQYGTSVGSPLSRRETEVALMVAQGYPNKTIAAVLEISSFTVSSYLRRIFAKLGVNTRAAMVARAVENRMLPEPVTPADAEPEPVRGKAR